MSHSALWMLGKHIPTQLDLQAHCSLVCVHAQGCVCVCTFMCVPMGARGLLFLILSLSILLFETGMTTKHGTHQLAKLVS